MSIQLIPSRASSDGAGVKIQRVHGFQSNNLDPFLMLDEIRSDNPDDYGAGFPAHPHRGIETLTYMRHGGFVHEDHLGNVGQIRSGEAQWMCAGKGVIHSEMPLQKDGLMHGFQLWINLPAADKLQPPAYRDIKRAELPWQPLAGGSLKLIAGTVTLDEQLFNGPLQALPATAAVADLQLSAGGDVRIGALTAKICLLYVYAGEVNLAGETVAARTLVRLSELDSTRLSSAAGAGMLLLSGTPINEPIAHYGPFVMNTQAEIDQAIRDYQQGTLTD